MLDVDKLMQASPPGSMVYARVHDGDEWRTALVIRENRKHIRALGAAPRVEVRAAMIEQDPVKLVAIMARIGTETYECWFNYWQTGGGADYAGDWQRQDRLPIVFYSDHGRERAISIKMGTFGDFWRRIGPELAASQPWSMRDFDDARDATFNEYPSPGLLWRRLGGG